MRESFSEIFLVLFRLILQTVLASKSPRRGLAPINQEIVVQEDI